jgi:signal transduction histidine kinase
VQFSFDVYWETDAQHRFIHQEFAENLADAPELGSEIGKTRWEVPYLEPDEEAWRKHRETLDAHLPFRDFEIARPGLTAASVTCRSRGCRYLTGRGASSATAASGGTSPNASGPKRPLRSAQAELAHANRVATMGQLTASVAHEVSQPIAATVMNAQAALRWIGAQPPNLNEVRQSLGQIVDNSTRAGDVIGRIRALIKKAPPQKEPWRSTKRSLRS